MSWSTFIKAHWGAIAATDLFTVEVVNPFGLVRYHVLFVIDIATRCVCIGGITSDQTGVDEAGGKNLTDMWDGFLLGKRYLIHGPGPAIQSLIFRKIKISFLMRARASATVAPNQGTRFTSAPRALTWGWPRVGR